MTSPIDFMRQAIALGERARYDAPPNPWVGCLIVKEGEIIGEGYTQPVGQPHAEICALQQAGEKAKGATLYVTLEPCPHTGQTPPCTEALIEAGIREVYVGIQDPDPRVQGKGVSRLQQAGIHVHHKLCEEEIRHALAPYLYHRRTTLPFTILKAAISLDGRMAAVNHASQWLTCALAREDAHLQRAASQAIVVGAGTALKDEPRLTVRHASWKHSQQPLRVVLDAKGRVPAKGALFDRQLAPTLVITTSLSSKEQRDAWELAGADVAVVAYSARGVDLHEAWHLLGKRSILQVLVEGGATLHTSLLETSLVNRLLIYIAPLFLGSSALPLYQKPIATLQHARRLSLQEVQRLDECVRLDYAIPIPLQEFDVDKAQALGIE